MKDELSGRLDLHEVFYKNLKDRVDAQEAAIKAKTEVELEEIATLKARMDALEVPKPTKKARRNSKGQYTKREKS